ncbi:hypothetical protein F2Q69_00016767 [Brassica cretica]|uniref:Uncharacterized protein n=1 Tax=Brassica cretica TaxID=69181 RepID=A0A8S9R8M0_BRACR|nr:hypothetical protein F2Q69_00016767 [Brassica cretica]
MSNLHQLLQFCERYGPFYWSPAKGWPNRIILPPIRDTGHPFTITPHRRRRSGIARSRSSIGIAVPRSSIGLAGGCHIHV